MAAGNQVQTFASNIAAKVLVYAEVAERLNTPLEGQALRDRGNTARNQALLP